MCSEIGPWLIVCSELSLTCNGSSLDITAVADVVLVISTFNFLLFFWYNELLQNNLLGH